MYAIFYGQMDVIQELIKMKADINIPNNNKEFKNKVIHQ